jgi:hypothetical protein
MSKWVDTTFTKRLSVAYPIIEVPSRGKLGRIDPNGIRTRATSVKGR